MITAHDHPAYDVVSEKTIVNAMVALLATGGSTNHSIHLVAIARAAGIRIDWEDFHELSRVVPLMTRLYPNGGRRTSTPSKKPAEWPSWCTNSWATG